MKSKLVHMLAICLVAILSATPMTAMANEPNAELGNPDQTVSSESTPEAPESVAESTQEESTQTEETTTAAETPQTQESAPETEEQRPKEKKVGHQARRSEAMTLTEKQKDLFRAFGISEDEINTMTVGKYADYLKTKQVVNVEPLMKYVDSAELEEDAKRGMEVVSNTLLDWGLTESEVEQFFARGLALHFFEEGDVDAIRETLSKEEMHPYEPDCHIFRGDRAEYLLAMDRDCHFARKAFPTTIDGVYVDYNAPEGSLENELKVDDLESKVMDAKIAFLYLYEVIDAGEISANNYSYFLWGEELGNKGHIFHEGVDFIYNGNGNGQSIDVRSIFDGEIVGIERGAASSSDYRDASSLMVYDEVRDVTLLYCHLNIDSSLRVGDWISKGETIGTQGKRGAGGYHTHLQVQDGIVDDERQIFRGDDTRLDSLEAFKYFYEWC